MRYSLALFASTAALFTLVVSSPIATYGIPHHPPAVRAVTNAKAVTNADRVAAVNADHAKVC